MPVKERKSQNAKRKTTTANTKVAAKKAETLKTVTRIAVKKPVVKKVSLTIDVYDMKGKVVESMKLPESIFGARVNKVLIAQAVRVYLANQRQGNASTKTRGEVTGSTRKIYQQKGTGRARHGGIRAPIFVKGGIAHGPKPHDFSLNLPQKMKRAALFGALSSKLAGGGIKVISGFEKIAPKTKKMIAALESLDLKKGRTLLVLSQKNEAIDRSSRNIENVSLILANQLNTYTVLQAKTLLIMKDAIETLEKTFVGK